MTRNEETFKEWINVNIPEEEIIPDNFEELLRHKKEIGSFIKLCLIRAIRPDRVKIASKQFITE